MQDNTITFPKGCLPYCGLQLTIQCPDLKEACWLHDQLLVIAPYMVSSTALYTVNNLAPYMVSNRAAPDMDSKLAPYIYLHNSLYG